MKSWLKILRTATPQNLLGFGYMIFLDTKTKSLNLSVK